MTNYLLPCWCRGPVAEDPCGHGETSQGCPRHDPNFEADDDEAERIAHEVYVNQNASHRSLASGAQ